MAWTRVVVGAERARLGQEADRAPPVLGPAGLHLAGLLGHVHVERQAARARRPGQRREPLRRAGADAVRRDAEAHQRVVLDRGGEVVEGREVGVGRRLHEAPLRRVRRAAGPVPRVGRPQEHQPQADVSGGPDHPQRQLGRVRVGPAVGVAVQVVELARAGDAGPGQLEEGEARHRLEQVWVEPPGRGVHGGPPGPEVAPPRARGGGVVRGRRARLGPSAQRSLEGVAVGGDEAGQEDPAGEGDALEPRQRGAGRDHHAVPHRERGPGAQRAAGEEEVGLEGEGGGHGTRVTPGAPPPPLRRARAEAA